MRAGEGWNFSKDRLSAVISNANVSSGTTLSLGLGWGISRVGLFTASSSFTVQRTEGTMLHPKVLYPLSIHRLYFSCLILPNSINRAVSSCPSFAAAKSSYVCSYRGSGSPRERSHNDLTNPCASHLKTCVTNVGGGASECVPSFKL